MLQAHCYIKGDVIGVGFRAWTKIQAKYLGVQGWVKNVGDEVEAVLQSDDEDLLQQMIAKLKAGSPVSRVDEVEILWENPTEKYAGFELLK